jgi:chromate transporter
VIAMLAMCGPTSVAAYFVGRASERFRGKIWHSAISSGLVPVTIGLIAASATVIATTADYGWTAAALTGATAIICYFARINPIWVFAAAAALGAVGLV